MFWFVLIEVLVIFACIFIAKKMVEKRIGFAKIIPIGVDDEQAIEKMENIAKEILESGKFEMKEELDGYEVEVKAKESRIQEVIIKSYATKVSYSPEDGALTESLAYTEKGGMAYIAFCLWACSLAVQFFVIFFAFVYWVYSMVA